MNEVQIGVIIWYLDVIQDPYLKTDMLSPEWVVYYVGWRELCDFTQGVLRFTQMKSVVHRRGLKEAEH